MSAFTGSSSLAIEPTVMAMLDWPLACQTSPTTTSRITMFWPAFWTRSSRPLALAARGLSVTAQEPSVAARRFGCLAGELDGHFFSLVRPSPNLDWSIALKDHVVREDAAQANLSPDVRSVDDRKQKQRRQLN